MKSPKIDIITIWYNREDYVIPSLMSLVKQTYKNINIIAVDDGSTDGTSKKLKEFEKIAKSKKVSTEIWIKNNEGFTVTLKKAIEERSKSEIFALHGSGDISHPTRIEKQLKALSESKSYAAVGCWVNVCDTNGKILLTRKCKFSPQKNLKKSIFPRPGTHESTLIRRHYYNKIGGYRIFFQMAQDSDLWLRMSCLGSIVNVQEALFDKIAIPQSISENHEKTIIQRAYSTLALQSALEIEKGNKDPISKWNSNYPLKYVNKSLLLRRMKPKIKEYLKNFNIKALFYILKKLF